MKLNKKILKQAVALLVKTIVVVLVLGITLYFSLRGYLLNRAIEKVAAKFKTEYQCNFHVEYAGFKGISGLRLSGISITPEGKDTLLRVNYFSTSIRFWYAIFGDIRVADLSMKDGYLQLIKNGDYRNFDNFLKKKDLDTSGMEEDNRAQKINYAEVAYNLLDKFFEKVPNEVWVQHFKVALQDDDRNVSFNLNELSLNQEIFDSYMKVQSGSSSQEWQVAGRVNLGKHKASLVFKRTDSAASSMVMIPYVKERFGLQAGFADIVLKLDGFDFENEQLELNGFASIKNLMLNHRRIAKEDVMVQQAEIKYRFLVGANFLSLDSTSEVVFNSIRYQPFFMLEEASEVNFKSLRNKKNAMQEVFSKYNIYLKVKTPKMLAQDFINALPGGLFKHIKGMETSGSFSYRLDFIHYCNRPQDLVFESHIEKDNLRITRYGEANLGKLNDEFVYTPYENGRPMRPIVVGLSNPNFTALDQISSYLKKCVLTTEDPFFFWHSGFVTEAFRQSIEKNIRTGRFARGASTISMQLVKNIFLSREKTMARKLEEILLVYILENNRIASKERMFEVYLNIIEWGPNVYGIGEASRFYFRKPPSELSLSECLYLATIIPRPKGFMWRFEKDGSPKAFLERTYRSLGNLMLRREVLLPEDTLGLTHQIKISGPALRYIIKNDSNVTDTILSPEDDFEEDINEEN